MKSTLYQRKRGCQFYILYLSILIIIASSIFPTIVWAQPDLTQKNKKIVTEYWTMLPTDPDEAFNRYVGDTYIQHASEYPDGKEGTIKQFKEVLAKNPENSGRIIQVIAENNMVVLHVHIKLYPEDPGMAGVEIYRVESGKIVEHWSVFQNITEQSLNSNSIF